MLFTDDYGRPIHARHGQSSGTNGGRNVIDTGLLAAEERRLSGTNHDCQPRVVTSVILGACPSGEDRQGVTTTLPAWSDPIRKVHDDLQPAPSCSSVRVLGRR
jgi:hypothetical protein